MFTRRDAFTAASVFLCANARGQQPAAPGPVFQHDLPNLTMDDWQVTVSEISVPPGRVGRPHRHPGFVLVYILEGTMITKISGQPETTYKAGQMFMESPGSTHEVSRNASDTQPAKFLALIFAKKGLPLTTPA